VSINQNAAENKIPHWPEGCLDQSVLSFGWNWMQAANMVNQILIANVGHLLDMILSP
jgi:hypothetical protein